MLEGGLDFVDLVEVVELAYDLTQDGFTVADQEIKKLFILLDVVGRLLARKEDFLLLGLRRLAIFGIWVLTFWGTAVFLELGDVALAEQMSVSNKLLTIEASHHAVQERLLVP